MRSRPALLVVLVALACAAPGAHAAPARPDLGVTTVSLSSTSVVAGATVQVTHSTRNGGSATARAGTRTALVLSRDAVRDARDVRLAARTLAALKARKISRATTTVRIPAGTAPGRHVILACADDGRRAKERDERNNCRASRALTVRSGPQTAAPVTGTQAPPSPAPSGPAPTPGPAQPEAGPTPVPTPTPAPGDTTAPVAPTLDRAAPSSGADTPTTRIGGGAEGGSTVRLYRSGSCAGPAVATTTASALTDGVLVDVPQGTTTTFTATAADAAGNTSPCSQGFPFTEVARAEVEPNGTAALADQRTTEDGVVLDRARSLDGVIDGAADQDVFRLALSDPRAVTVQLRSRGGANCPAATGSGVLEILGDDGTTPQPNVASPVVSGVCETRVVSLPAGVRYVRVGAPGSSSLDYEISMSLAPVATPLATSPASPAASTTPLVRGEASAGSTVRLYTRPDCGGAVAATGSASTFAAVGLEVAVPTGLGRTFHAQAELDGQTGPCSTELLRYRSSVGLEIEPNGTLAEADAQAGAGTGLTDAGLVSGTFATLSDVDVYRFVVTTSAFFRLRTSDETGTTPCRQLDTVMTLLTPAGTQVAQNDDAGGTQDLCSQIETALEPGTYYVRVVPFQQPVSDPRYDYALRTTVLPTATPTATSPASPAADGAPEVTGTATAGATVRVFRGADCSGEAVATGTAAQFAAPGLTVTVPDGTTVALRAQATLGAVTGPCSAPLSYRNSTGDAPATPEVEPNGTIDRATPLAVPGVASGAIATVGDVDLFRIVVTGDRVHRLETFDASAGTCTGADTGLRLLAVNGAPVPDVTTADVRDAGIGTCSALTVRLAPGTYYAEVTEDGNNGTIGAYTLAVRPVVDAGSEVEPNDTAATATALTGTELSVRGGHQLADDTDWYSFTVSGAPRSVRLETVEGSTAETCESDGVDTRIDLFAANGTTVLATNDDGGRGYCSLLDGADGLPGAANLAPGTYYVRVTAAVNPDVSARQFDYRLVLTQR